ncbi:MAG: DUF2157 domain-containing protein [bacterium]
MTEQKHWAWLIKKIEVWEREGILEKSQAQRLLNEKPSFHAEHNLATRILIGISTLLLGLGVISFFAFNWQAMPKWLKLATIFSAFIASHITGRILENYPSKKALSEFFYLLGTFLFGANIILIAQIYHIEAHAPNGVFLWSIGALIMAYVLYSSPQMLLFGALIVVWQGMEKNYHIPQLWVVFCAAIGMIPFAIMKKHWFSTSVATITLLLTISIQMTFSHMGIIGNCLFLGVMCIGIGLLIRRTRYSSCAKPPEVCGFILYFGTLVALTFKEGVREFFSGITSSMHLSDVLFPMFIVFITLCVWGYYVYPLHTFPDRFRNLDRKHVFIPFAAFLLAVILWSSAANASIKLMRHELLFIGMVGFNIIALVHGIILIFKGTRSGEIGKSFIGCAVIVIIIISRFIAYSDNLLWRSFSFMLAGGFILGIAIKTSKMKRRRA